MGCDLPAAKKEAFERRSEGEECRNGARGERV